MKEQSLSEEKQILIQMHDNSLQPWCKALIQRWITMESWTPDRIGQLKKILSDWTVKVDGNSNRMDDLAMLKLVGDKIFTEEEISYINLIGNDWTAVHKVLIGHRPSGFLSRLQQLAIQRIRGAIIRCFEPSLTDEDIQRCWTRHLANKKSSSPTDKGHVILLCWSFNQLISKINDESQLEKNSELEWLVWLRDVVIPSLRSYVNNSSTDHELGPKGFSVYQMVYFFKDIGEKSLDVCRAATTSGRPHCWTDLLAIFAIDELLVGSTSKWLLSSNHHFDRGSGEVIRKLLQWWPSSGTDPDEYSSPKSILHIFYQKIVEESTMEEPIIHKVEDLVNQLTLLEPRTFHGNKDILARFAATPLKDWPACFRYARLASQWSSELACLLTNVLDSQLGSEQTDRCLELYVRHRRQSTGSEQVSDDCRHRLERICRHLIRYPWIKEQLIPLIDSNDHNQKNASVWDFLSDAGAIEKEMVTSSRVDLTLEEIVTIMSRDVHSKVFNSHEDRMKMIRKVTNIRQDYQTKTKSWNRSKIIEWTKQIKSYKTPQLRVEEFLSVACRVIQEKEGYLPRDVQLIAVMVFVWAEEEDGGSVQCWNRMPKRMGQISTGEGKTLISALVAIYHALRHWNRDRHVNIITSSSVLAEANVTEIRWLYDAFGLSVGNNCDQECSGNDAIRRERYNLDIVYGELGSFMRDLLLTDYLDKDVTRNRKPGAVIVDEVDSMLLDKGENILYMSHNVPEMYDLMTLFVDIWTHINAPDVLRLAESSDIVREVTEMILPSVDRSVPNCLYDFAKRHLSTWIESAFRARYLLKPNDAYKVDDVGDGRGKRIIIMDKETGVEQVETEWSDGLQQFLQLKHGLKWTPIALRAVYMSNIGYFSQLNGRLYGLTGTLGSEAECDLLNQAFGVEFFRVPRFRRRFCLHQRPVVTRHRQDWLDQIRDVVERLVSNKQKKRAVLVVCENIEAANSVHDILAKLTTNGADVVKFVSSFDETFKSRQQESIRPGQVMVATNLAGRGTDLKPNGQLIENGGLHVIVTFMPANARIEAQAEGRTARAGQPGSFQFIIEPSVDDHQQPDGPAFNPSDPYSQLCQLKSKRDEQERQRLDHIRQKALPKIKLEDQLFHDYHQRCLRRLDELIPKDSMIESLLLASSLRREERIQIIRHCLTNRWALWLEERAGLIEKSGDQVIHDRLRKEFDQLVSQSSVVMNEIESVVTSPSEWMMLGRAYEEASLTSSAKSCYERIISQEPLWSENALMDRARLELANDAGHQRKIEAKKFLKKAKERIENRIESLNELVQRVDECQNRHQMMETSGLHLCNKRFEDQVNNQIRLWRIHASAVDQLLGVSLKNALAGSIGDNQKIDHVLDFLLKNHGATIKPFHFARGASIKSSQGSSSTTKTIYCGSKPIEWPPFVIHCVNPLTNLVQQKTSPGKSREMTLAEVEQIILKSESELWKRLVGVYIGDGQRADKVKTIEPHAAALFSSFLAEMPRKGVLKDYQRILPGWLKDHAGEDFSRVGDTLGIEDVHQLAQLANWLEEKKLIVPVDKGWRHRILKTIPSMADGVDVQLVDGVPLASCADVVTAWFSSTDHRDGHDYIYQPDFDKRKRELAKQFRDYLIDFGVVKEPALRFSFINRKRDEIKTKMEDIKSWMKRLEYCSGFEELARTTFPDDGNEKSTDSKKKEKLLNALTDAIEPHLGQLKTLAQVKSSFSSLYAALPPAGDGQPNTTDEVHQFNERRLDRVVKVDEYVSRWDWRIGVIALLGVIQLAGAMAFPFFSSGLIGEGLNDLAFAFQCLQSPGSFSWKSYFVDKATSMAITVVSMGIGAARLIKACGKGGLKQAAKLMIRFNGNLKAWCQIGKQILIRCANMISSSVIGQAVNRFLTWLNKFILENVLNRVKSFLFNNTIFSTPFVQLRELMRSIMKLVTEDGKSASEASRIIKDVLERAKQSSAAQDWHTELRSKASTISNRMMNIFNDSSAGLGNLKNSFAGEFRKKASIGNTSGITASANAGTIEKAIQIGKTVIDYGEKAAKAVNQINTLTTNLESTFKLATHGATYVGDLNAALRDELRKLNGAKKQSDGQQQSQSVADSKRFDQFVSETEKEIQNSIMKHALDTIQTTWLEPYVQRKVEKHVSDACSKMIQKYCPALMPEGVDDLKDGHANNDDDDNDETYDQWVEGMGGGNLAGPVDMQNAVDGRNFILDIEDETGEYTKGSNDKNFVYYPEGNPYSDAPRIKVKFTADPHDGTKHITLVLPDGTVHDIQPDPSKPANRCFYDAISKGLNDPSTDHTIHSCRNYAKDNERARCMHNLGANNSYRHLHAGLRKPVPVPGGGEVKKDVHGRTLSYEKTASKNQLNKTKRDPKRTKLIKEEMSFSEGEDYGHLDAVGTGGPDTIENIARMTSHCNRKTFRKVERDFESFMKSNPNESITRRIEVVYQHKSDEITRMHKQERVVTKDTMHKALGFKYSFSLANDPSNYYEKYVDNAPKPKRSDKSVPPFIAGDKFKKHFSKNP